MPDIEQGVFRHTGAVDQMVPDLLSALPRSPYQLIDFSTNNSLSRLRSKIVTSRLVAGNPRARLKHDRIIAVHFPKAGGSSLQHQFANLLRSGIYLNYESNPMDKFRYPIDFPRGKSMVFGHFHPVLYDTTKAFRMTFLRHPVDNILSIYSFWKNRPPNRFDKIHHKFLKENPTVYEFCKYSGIANLMSETYFGGFDMKRFDFIGFHETREIDIRRLSELVGAEISPRVHLNPTRYNEQDEYLIHNQNTRNRIADIVKTDIDLYEYVRSLPSAA